ncbi:MAG: LacI family DNA-binding transcriptional regulator, partial [Oscillospiraceae bacterium]
MNLKEIAKQAGVSSATVSMVLHNKDGVSKETRIKIENMLRENEYKISDKLEIMGTSGAKNIRFLKYSLSSYLVDDNPGFISSIIDSVERECRRLGYNLMMTAFKKKNADEIFQNLKKENPDGIVLLGTEWTDEDCKYLDGMNIPIVVLDNYIPNRPLNCVTGSPQANISTAMRFLYNKGHREIGYLMNTEPSCNCIESYKSYRETVCELGLKLDENIIFNIMPTFAGAYESMKEILKTRSAMPTALLTNNDNLALGAMKALKESGYRVPEDVALIGSDDTAAAAMSDPPLTTMHPDCKRIGIWAMRLLCDIIEYPDI